jgi:hypothetical protein
MPNTWATIINFPFIDQSSDEYEMKRISMWQNYISDGVEQTKSNGECEPYFTMIISLGLIFGLFFNY